MTKILKQGTILLCSDYRSCSCTFVNSSTRVISISSPRRILDQFLGLQSSIKLKSQAAAKTVIRFASAGAWKQIPTTEWASPLTIIHGWYRDVYRLLQFRVVWLFSTLGTNVMSRTEEDRRRAVVCACTPVVRDVSRGRIGTLRNGNELTLDAD